MCSINETAFHLTRRSNRLWVFMERGNYQPQLVSKDITSNIDDVSVLFEESTEYELKVETFTLARGQNYIEMFGLILALFYIVNAQYPKKLERWLFLQNFLLGKGDQSKMPQKVLELISKVKKAAI